MRPRRTIASMWPVADMVLFSTGGVLHGTVGTRGGFLRWSSNPQTMLRHLPILPMVFLTLILAACGSSTPPDASSSTIAVPPPSDDTCIAHAMPRCVLDSLQALFGGQFCVSTPRGCVKFLAQEVLLDPQVFRSAILDVPVTEGQVRGVWMHYGLSVDWAFTVGFRFLVMDPDTAGIYDLDTAGTNFFVPGANGDLLKASYAQFATGPLARYLSFVMVRRTIGAAATHLNPDSLFDRTSYLLPWECVVQGLYDDNQNVLGDSTELVIASIAQQRQEPRDLNNDMRHELSFYFTNDTALVDNTVYPGAPFKLKSADNGMACPPACDSFRYRSGPMTPCK